MRHIYFTFIILISFSLITCSDNGTGTEDPTTYSINVTLSPSNSGTISPDLENTVEEGEDIELQATPNDGYLFSGWTGDIESSNNPLSITASEDLELTANFDLKSYELTIDTEGEGTVDEEVIQQKSADYEHGTLVELTATPAEGYKFVEWQGDLTGSDNPAQITIDEPKNVTAVFEKKTYELTVDTDGEGAVSEEIVQQKTTDYEHGTVVELTASPSEGWKFIEWTGDLSGSENPSQITVDQAKEVTAVFEKESYAMTIEKNGEGTVSKTPDQAEYEYNSSVELEATPAEGYKFVEWQGDLTGSDNPAQITIDEPKNVTAVFEMEIYTLTTSTSGEGSLSFSTDNTEFKFGESVEITAEPDTGWEFVGWQGDETGSSNPLTVTFDESKEIEAIFQRKTYSLSVTTEGEGSISKSPDQSEYEYESEVELTANAAEGWEFVEWTGDIAGNENPTSLIVDDVKEVNAVFEKQSFTIQTTVQGDGSIELSPQKDEYEYNEEVEVTAVPQNDFKFIRWSGDLSGNENPTLISITEEMSIEAIFKTIEDALIYIQGGGVFINNRVHSASLQLHNTLPEDLNLLRITLKNLDDNVVVENTDGAIIESGEGINFNVSFGIQPTIEDFEQYTVEWEVDYNGETIVKTNTVGESDSFMKMKQQNLPTIEIKAN